MIWKIQTHQPADRNSGAAKAPCNDRQASQFGCPEETHPRENTVCDSQLNLVFIDTEDGIRKHKNLVTSLTE